MDFLSRTKKEGRRAVCCPAAHIFRHIGKKCPFYFYMCNSFSFLFTSLPLDPFPVLSGCLFCFIITKMVVGFVLQRIR